jgi:hypothetical protein
MKRHVLVNVCPFDICVSSGTVTSAIIRALSWQMPPADSPAVTAVPVPAGVPGVAVVEASGVDDMGVSVGSARPGRVGGRVEVTKTGRVGAGVSPEILTHEPRLRLRMASKIQMFFIGE